MNEQKEQRAIQYLKEFEPEDRPYRLCYSGGKDSDCIRILAQLAGVNHECKHNLTTVDAPETVYYVRDMIGRENIELPERTMWELIVDSLLPPTRYMRYCCSALKENHGSGQINITGVRWAESSGRRRNQGLVTVMGKPKTMQREAEKMSVDFRVTPKSGLIMNDDNAESRRFIEFCYRTTKTMLNPIVDWTDKDVWEFLHHYGCASNPLYAQGETRIGCIGCPMQGFAGMKRDFARYPKYRAAYVRAFDKMLKARTAKGKKTTWSDGEAVMKWWVGDDPNQLSFFDEI